MEFYGPEDERPETGNPAAQIKTEACGTRGTVIPRVHATVVKGKWRCDPTSETGCEILPWVADTAPAEWVR